MAGLLFYSDGAPRDLHSFPTRRSSDLGADRGAPLRVSALRPSRLRLLAADARRPDPRRRVPRFLARRSEEHTSELQSHVNLVCRLLLEKKKISQLDAF